MLLGSISCFYGTKTNRFTWFMHYFLYRLLLWIPCINDVISDQDPYMLTGFSRPRVLLSVYSLPVFVLLSFSLIGTCADPEGGGAGPPSENSQSCMFI